MIISANTQNLHQDLEQQSYNDILRISNELIALLHHDAPQGSNSAAFALQWTAMERLLDLIDKH